ncbi:MAG TPA: hypothetical protein VGO34_14145 [Alphaproteobacteria bacterium]
MRHSATIALALSAASLAACAGSPRTISDQYSTYTYEDYATAANNRDMKVIVRGTPFAMSQADFDTLVTANMEARGGNMGTNFTTGNTTNADPRYKIVWLFNGPAATQANELCKNPAGFAGQTGPATELHTLVAFCSSDAAASWVEGWLDGGPQGVPREGLQKLVQQSTRELFPSLGRDDPRRSGGSCGGDGC